MATMSMGTGRPWARCPWAQGGIGQPVHGHSDGHGKVPRGYGKVIRGHGKIFQMAMATMVILVWVITLSNATF